MTKDYSGQNLRGRSFKGQNLEGADFSGADIRGADFTEAKLKGANFTGVKAGVKNQWIALMLLISCLLSSCIGFTSALNGYCLVYFFLPSRDQNIVLGSITLIVYIILLIVTITKGIELASRLLPAFIFITAILAITGVGAVAISVAITIAAIVVFVIIGAILFAFIDAFANNNVANFFTIISIIAAVILTINGAVSNAFTVAFTLALPNVNVLTGTTTIAFIFTIVLAVIALAMSRFIAWQALKDNDRLTLVYAYAITFTPIVGTTFHGADLSDADFTNAIIKSTDLRNAILTHTQWFHTQKVNYSRLGNSYLKYPKVRQLVTTRRGQEQNFDRLDLSRINLKEANLKDASFVGTDLNHANLQDADLSRAKLVQAQLDGTDFTGATLTGAFIKDWGITTDTKFDGVICEYVFMRSPTKDDPNPHRKPDNWNETFADDDFADFIKPIVDTLDLYHNSGIDPRAIAIAFKELAEKNPDAELRIVGMEVKGEDKFLLRAKTAATADKSELSAEYFDTYNQIKGLPEREIRLLLSEKDSRIRSLETMVTTTLERPSFYSNTQVGTVSTMTNNPGGFSVGGSVGGNVNNVQGDNNRAVQGDNNQAVLGDNNQVTQQNQVSGDASLTKDDVVKLLVQLEALVKAAEIPAETKEEVIEDLSSAKKATDKEEPNKNRALERLGSVAETLEKTSKGVDAGQKIWTTAKPIIVKIATWLGAAAGSHLLGL